MKKVLSGIGTLVVVTLVVSLFWVAPAARPAAAQDAAPGQDIFMAQKCNLCHSVSTVSIEAKTTSDKMKGPDLVGISADAATLTPYLKGESEINGAKHKKKATCSDDELKVLIEWVLAQK